MAILETIFPCFAWERQHYIEIKDIDEKPVRPVFTEKALYVPSSLGSKNTSGYARARPPPSIYSQNTNIDEQNLAKDILGLLYATEDRNELSNQIRATGWTDALARHLLDGLVNALNTGAAMGTAMKEAFDKVSMEANKFVHEHPVLTAAITTIIAIGILEIMVPWAIAALGFGELGPIEGLNFYIIEG
jgi:hypothetical protein